MAISVERQRDFGPGRESLYGLPEYGASGAAGPESRQSAGGRWWWRNIAAITGSLLLANFVYTIIEASGSSNGYTKMAPWDFVIFPAEDLLFDAPLFALGCIPLMLAAWYMPYYWSTVKQRALIAVTALLVPLPHLIVVGGASAIATQSNLMWSAVLMVAATVSTQAWAMHEGRAATAVVDVRSRGASINAEEQLQRAGIA